MKLLTAEAARIIGVTPAAIRAMEARGELVAERTPTGTRLFDAALVQRLAAERAERRSAPMSPEAA